MGTDSSAQQKKRHGFSLVESAIVLAVVGLVIGGIWYSAAAMIENYKVNKTAADLQLIVKNIQNLMSIRDSETIGNSVMIHDMLVKAGSFPKDWITPSQGLKNPFGGVVYVGNYTPPLGSEAARFYIMLYGSIAHSACAKLIVKVSSMGAMAGSKGSGYYSRSNLGVVGLVNTDTGVRWETSVFPITPDKASSVCYTHNTISFGFGYTRIN